MALTEVLLLSLHETMGMAARGERGREGEGEKEGRERERKREREREKVDMI